MLHNKRLILYLKPKLFFKINTYVKVCIHNAKKKEKEKHPMFENICYKLKEKLVYILYLCHYEWTSS